MIKLNNCAAICMFAFVGFAFGGLAVPGIAALALERKKQQLDSWWLECLSAYARELSNAPGFQPDPKGVLGKWRKDVERQIRNGSFSKERAAQLEAAGIIPASMLAACGELKTEEELAARYRSPVSVSSRVLWGLLLGLFLAAAYVTLPISQLILASVFVAILSVMAFVDAAVHILPFELSAVLYPVALLYVFIRSGLHGVLSGLLCGLCVMAFIALASVAMRTELSADPIGKGDARVLPACAIACGFEGALTAVVLLAVVPLVGIAVKRLMREKITLKTRIAMGPYILIACMSGILVAG